MRALSNRATFYVPSETEQGQDLALNIAQQAAIAFGGSTVTSGIRIWAGVPEGGDGWRQVVGGAAYLEGHTEGIVTEKITLVTVFTTQEKRIPLKDFIEDAARRIGSLLDQEAVAVEVNGALGLYERGTDYV